MATSWKLDDRLVRAIRGGPSALPEDLVLLRSYLRMIAGLMEEKAASFEPDWPHACSEAAEVETLLQLESVVAERAVGVPSADLDDVRTKFEIWRALAPGAADGDLDLVHNRLVLSIEADILRLQQRQRG